MNCSIQNEGMWQVHQSHKTMSDPIALQARLGSSMKFRFNNRYAVPLVPMWNLVEAQLDITETVVKVGENLVTCLNRLRVQHSA